MVIVQFGADVLKFSVNANVPGLMISPPVNDNVVDEPIQIDGAEGVIVIAVG